MISLDTKDSKKSTVKKCVPHRWSLWQRFSASSCSRHPNSQFQCDTLHSHHLTAGRASQPGLPRCVWVARNPRLATPATSLWHSHVCVYRRKGKRSAERFVPLRCTPTTISTAKQTKKMVSSTKISLTWKNWTVTNMYKKEVYTT